MSSLTPAQFSVLCLAVAANAAFPHSQRPATIVGFDTDGSLPSLGCDPCDPTSGRTEDLRAILRETIEPLAQATCAERDDKVPVWKQRVKEGSWGHTAMIESLENRCQGDKKTAETAKLTLNERIRAAKRMSFYDLYPSNCNQSPNPRHPKNHLRYSHHNYPQR